MPKEKTKAVTISLTEQEEKDLIQVSEKFFGQSNKSGMVRYWIKKAKDEGSFILMVYIPSCVFITL